MPLLFDYINLNDTWLQVIEKLNRNLKLLEEQVGPEGKQGIPGFVGLPGPIGPQGEAGNDGLGDKLFIMSINNFIEYSNTPVNEAKYHTFLTDFLGLTSNDFDTYFEAINQGRIQVFGIIITDGTTNEQGQIYKLNAITYNSSDGTYTLSFGDSLGSLILLQQNAGGESLLKVSEEPIEHNINTNIRSLIPKSVNNSLAFTNIYYDTINSKIKAVSINTSEANISLLGELPVRSLLNVTTNDALLGTSFGGSIYDYSFKNIIVNSAVETDGKKSFAPLLLLGNTVKNEFEISSGTNIFQISDADKVQFYSPFYGIGILTDNADTVSAKHELMLFSRGNVASSSSSNSSHTYGIGFYANEFYFGSKDNKSNRVKLTAGTNALTVNGTLKVSNGYSLELETDTNTGLRIFSDRADSKYLFFHYDTTNSRYLISKSNNDSSSSLLLYNIIYTDGTKVGIGTTSVASGYSFEVAGNTKISGELNVGTIQTLNSTPTTILAESGGILKKRNFNDLVSDLHMLSLNGGELSGPISFSNAVEGNIKVYKNVASFHKKPDNSFNYQGTIKITLPKGWSSTMLNLKVYGSIYSNSQKNWELNLYGYNNVSSFWANTNAKVFGRCNFTKVRFGYDTTLNKCVILLGETSTTWYYPSINIAEVIASYSSIDGWNTGWNIELITNESNISNIVEASFEQLWSSLTQGAGSGLNADLLDGKHATAFALASHTHTKSQITDFAHTHGNITNDGKLNSANNLVGTNSSNTIETKSISLDTSGKALIFSTNNYFGWGGQIAVGAGYAMNLKNSDIIGANAIVFNDIANDGKEGLIFPAVSSPASTSDYASIAVHSDKELYLWKTLGSERYRVLHTGNYGHTKGINADMLDGKHASEFVQQAKVTKNNIIEEGWYRIAAKTSNIASGLFKVTFYNSFRAVGSSNYDRGQIIFNATNFSNDSSSIKIDKINSTARNSKFYVQAVRIVYNESSSNSYIDLYIKPDASYCAVSATVTLIDGDGWTLETNWEKKTDIDTKYPFGETLSMLQAKSFMSNTEQPLYIDSIHYDGTSYYYNLNTSIRNNFYIYTGTSPNSPTKLRLLNVENGLTGEIVLFIGGSLPINGVNVRIEVFNTNGAPLPIKKIGNLDALGYGHYLISYKAFNNSLFVKIEKYSELIWLT